MEDGTSLQRRRSARATSSGTSSDQRSSVLKATTRIGPVLPGKNVSNGFEVGSFGIRLWPYPTEPAEVIHYQIHVLIAAFRYDRRRPKLSRYKTGIQADWHRIVPMVELSNVM